MAAATHTSAPGTGYTGDGSVFGGKVIVTETHLSDGVQFGPNNVTKVRHGEAGAANDQTKNTFHLKDCVLYIEYFSACVETNTYESGLGSDLIAVAYQADNPDETNPLNATINNENGQIIWDGPSGSSPGWLWMLCRPGTTKTPAA